MLGVGADTLLREAASVHCAALEAYRLDRHTHRIARECAGGEGAKDAACANTVGLSSPREPPKFGRTQPSSKSRPNSVDASNLAHRRPSPKVVEHGPQVCGLPKQSGEASHSSVNISPGTWSSQPDLGQLCLGFARVLACMSAMF